VLRLTQKQASLSTYSKIDFMTTDGHVDEKKDSEKTEKLVMFVN